MKILFCNFWSKVLFVCLFVCLFICLFVLFLFCLKNKNKKQNKNKHYFHAILAFYLKIEFSLASAFQKHCLTQSVFFFFFVAIL